MTEYPALCSSTHCRPDERGGPRRTERAWFCPTCVDRMREQLGYGYTNHLGEHIPGIAEMWADLEDNLARNETITDPDQGHQKNGGKAHGSVINEGVSEAMRDARNLVWFLVRAILDHADNHGTNIKIPDDQSTPSLADWLARWHIDTIAAGVGRMTALAAIEDTRSAWLACKRRAYPTGGRKVDLGIPCEHHGTNDMGERTTCPGVMVAYVSPARSGLPDLVCTEDDSHRLAPEVWMRDGWKRAHATMSRSGARALAERIRA